MSIKITGTGSFIPLLTKKNKDFLDAKLITSSIYISSILPKIESLQTIIMNGDEDVLSMKQNWL